MLLLLLLLLPPDVVDQPRTLATTWAFRGLLPQIRPICFRGERHRSCFRLVRLIHRPHRHLDTEFLGRPAAKQALGRWHVQIVPPNGAANVMVRHQTIVGGIESYPAQAR